MSDITAITVPAVTATKRTAAPPQGKPPDLGVDFHYETGDARGGHAHAFITEGGFKERYGITPVAYYDLVISDGQQSGTFVVTPTTNAGNITVMITNHAGLSNSVTVAPPYGPPQ